MTKTIQYRGTGRRKTSIARVRLLPGTGKYIVNGQTLDQYFDYEILRREVQRPLDLTKTVGKYDVIVKVEGWWFYWTSWCSKTWSFKSIITS